MELKAGDLVKIVGSKRSSKEEYFIEAYLGHTGVVHEVRDIIIDVLITSGPRSGRVGWFYNEELELHTTCLTE